MMAYWRACRSFLWIVSAVRFYVIRPISAFAEFGLRHKQNPGTVTIATHRFCGLPTLWRSTLHDLIINQLDYPGYGGDWVGG